MIDTPPRKFSLRRQITWRVALISGVAIVCLLATVYGALLVTLNRAYREIQDTAHVTAHEIDNFLVTIETDLTASAASLPYASDPDLMLRDLLNRQENILAVRYVDTSGAVIASRRRVGQESPTVIEEQPWLASQNPYWGDIYTSPNGLPLVDVAVPITEADITTSPDRLGTLVATLDMTSFWQRVRDIQVGKSGYAYLTDSDGLLLVYRDLSLVQRGATLADLRGEDFQSEVLGVNRIIPRIYHGIEGGWVISSANALETRPWALVVEEPFRDMLNDLYPVFAMSALVMVFIVSIIINTWQFLYRRMILPLGALRTGVSQFQQGELSWRVRLDDHAHDEIAALSQHFNEMAESIEKRTEELVIARAKAIESSRLKSEFLSIISHELRTPLNAILGYTDLLLQGMAGSFDAETRRMLTSVDKSGERLLRLIDDLLDLSTIEAGKTDLQMIAFNPHSLSRQWWEEHTLQAGHKNLAFTIKIDPALPHKLYGDPERITQIATNLLTNAIKFTDERGEVTLHVGQQPGAWIITVRDTGIGIPAHAQEHIFDAFRQVDSSATRQHGGTGLGLSIVRNLAALMGGTVRLESTPGEGSCFSVSLPLITEPRP